MLPADLFVASLRGGCIHPRFLDLSYESLYVAEETERVFEEGVGRRRGEIEEALRELEDRAFRLGINYKSVRGLAYLLAKRAVFEPPISGLDPIKIRVEVFRRAGKIGYTSTGEERKRVIGETAGALGLTPDAVEKALTAVYEQEFILKSFATTPAEELVREYNLSLAQTALFKAVSLTVVLGSSGTAVKNLLRQVKRLGLLYTASIEGGNLRLEIDGPASLFRQTERYGTRLAKLLPLLLHSEKWSLKARVKTRRAYALFELDSAKAPPLPRRHTVEVEFDSEVEKDFYKSFVSLGSEWKIVREPEPLVAGRSVFIPDFAFETQGLKVYMEIVGFWTPTYLKRKVEKLKSLHDVKMILAVDEEGACAPGLLDLPYTIIKFKRKVPIDQVYKTLRAIKPPQQKPKKEAEFPREVIDFLRGVQSMPLTQLLEKLSQMGLSEEQAYYAIRAAGLKIDWNGIDPRKAVVRS